MTITQAKAVYDRNHIDKDNIANKDFALERDQARYELFAAELPPRDICDFRVLLLRQDPQPIRHHALHPQALGTHEGRRG
jgi:hypothetical protein